MQKFSDFNIKSEIKPFTGEKIKIKKILNVLITVIEFKLEVSKFGGDCLYLQIQKGDDKHVVFTSSKYLIEAIKQLKKEQFPFETTIVENDDRFEFT